MTCFTKLSAITDKRHFLTNSLVQYRSIIQSNILKITLIVLCILIIVFIISQIYFTMAKTETQPYQISKTEKDFEIRHYPPARMPNISMAAKT